MYYDEEERATIVRLRRLIRLEIAMARKCLDVSRSCCNSSISQEYKAWAYEHLQKARALHRLLTGESGDTTVL